MKMKIENVFIKTSPERLGVQEGDLIHCQMFKGDDSKYVLREIQNLSQLKDVQSVLIPTSGAVVRVDEIMDFAYRLAERLSNKIANKGFVNVSFDDEVDQFVTEELRDKEEPTPLEINEVAFNEIEQLIQQKAENIFGDVNPNDINADFLAMVNNLKAVSDEIAHLLDNHFERKIGIVQKYAGSKFIYWNNRWRRLPA